MRLARDDDVTDERFLDHELEDGHFAVGHDERVGGPRELAERGVGQVAQGGQREIDQRQARFGGELRRERKKFLCALECVAARERADERALFFADTVVGVEEERVDERAGFGGLARSVAQTRRHTGEELLRIVGLLRREAAGERHGGEWCEGLEWRRGGFLFGEAGVDERLVGDVDDFGWLDELAVPARIDGADALVERRVRGPESAEVGAETLGEKEMTDLRRVRVADVGAEGEAADFAEGVGDAARVARELDGGGVGEKLTLARHGSLDESAEKIADVADDQQREADGEDDRHAAAVFLAAAEANPPAAERLQDAAAEHADNEDAEDDGGELYVEAHVAVENVAELVRDDALQLVAVEFVERAARDGDDGVARGEAGSEGVEAGLVVHHVDGRHGHARGDGHFLDDVEQAAFAEVGGVRIEAAPAGHLGDGAAAVAHLRPFVERGEADDSQGAERDAGKNLRIPPTRRCGRLLVGVGAGVTSVPRRRADLAEHEDGGDIAREDRAEDSEREEQDEPVGPFPRAFLSLEEIHGSVGWFLFGQESNYRGNNKEDSHGEVLPPIHWRSAVAATKEHATKRAFLKCDVG